MKLSKAYEHVIIIDPRSSYLSGLKKTLLSINYALHVSSFENPKIAIKYIKNCKKIPEVVFLNLIQFKHLEFITSFVTEYKQLTKFIYISAFESFII
jgi:hypothetical protein